jgi:hypothetical protein
MRLLGSLTVVSLGSYIGIMFLRDRRRGDAQAGARDQAASGGEPGGPAADDVDTDLVP